MASRDTIYGANRKLGWNDQDLGFPKPGLPFCCLGPSCRCLSFSLFHSFFLLSFLSFFFFLSSYFLLLFLSLMIERYGLTCHPQRPFVFASSSRDTTLRVWTMTREAARARMRALCAPNAWNAIVGDVDAVMRGDAILSGKGSRELVQKAKAARTEAQRMQVYF